MNRHRIREFEALRAVVTTGTTVGAARRLGVSQPAISRSLTQLEERLGRTLFLRASGRIEPTPEALSLNETLDPLFAALAKIDGAEWAEMEMEPLRIAVPPTLAHHFVLARVASFLQQDNARRVQLEIQPTEQIVSGIAERIYDIGLTSAMIQRAGVKLVPWRRSQIVCVLPVGHPLAARETITPLDLDGIDVVGFLRRLGTRTVMEQVFNRAGIRPKIIAETATNMAAVELTRSGIGVTLVNPFPLLTVPQEGLEIRSFETEVEYRTSFVLPTHRPSTTLARHFMRHIKLTTPDDQYSEAMK